MKRENETIMLGEFNPEDRLKLARGESIAVDVTVQNVEILRGRLEQATKLLLEYDLRGHSEAWWVRVEKFLASQQVEQCPKCEGSGKVSDSDGCGVWYNDCPSCAKKHPEQAEGAQGERSGWGSLPIVQVPWNVFDRAVMWVEDRRRYGDDGTIVDDWMALKAIQRAALAQPSPAPELDDEYVPEGIVEAALSDSQVDAVGLAAAALAPELERPEVEHLIPDNIPRFVLVEGRMSQSGSGTWMRDSWLHLIQDQHDRIVGALRIALGNTEALLSQANYHKAQRGQTIDELRAENQALRSDLGAESSKCNSMEALAAERAQERDAAKARAAELTAPPSFNYCRCGDERLPEVSPRSNALGPYFWVECPNCGKSVSSFTFSGAMREWNAVCRTPRKPVAQAGQVPELDQLYSMLGADDQVDAAKKIAELVGCRLSRSALTEAQMRRLYENSTDAENERLGFAAFARLIRRAESVHQIAAAPAQGGE